MNKMKIKGFFILLFIFTMVILTGNIFATSTTTKYVQVHMTVKHSDGTVLKGGNAYTNIKGGDVIYITAHCDNEDSLYWSQNLAFMDQYGYKKNDKGMAIINYYYSDVVDGKITNSTKIESTSNPYDTYITVKEFAPGTKHVLSIEGIAAVDNWEGHEAQTGWVNIYFTVPTEETKPLTGDIAVTHNNKTLANGSTTTITTGSKATVSMSPFQNFSYIEGSWQIGNNAPTALGLRGESSYTLDIPGVAGQTIKLTLTGVLKDGGKTATKTYTFKIPALVTTIETAILKLNSTTLTADANIINGTFSKFLYHWDNEPDKESTSKPLNITIPNFEAKEVETQHILTVKALTTNGKSDIETYTVTIPANRVPIEPDEPTIPDIPAEPDEPSISEPVGEELIIEDWMREYSDAEGLLISLRNDSEEKKANKNFYQLDEEIIYYIDYKNCGEDITNAVKIVLKLPLEFTAVDSSNGTISKNNKTITWTFEKGLEEEQSGTITVILKYKYLDNDNYNYELVYPQATIYKGNREEDVSTVINYIYVSETTVIDDEHEPYMFGDKDAPTFRPDDTITRAEGALVLTRIFGINTSRVSVTSKFSDIGDTYLEAQKAITAASNLGIINGYEDGTYKPNNKMTRAEFMKIIASYIAVLGEDENIEGLELKDETNIKIYRNPIKKNHWAIPYVTLLARLNMTSVSAKEKDLRLDDEITRAEVAQLVNFYSFRAPAKITSKVKVSFTDVPRTHDLIGDIVEATRENHTFTIESNGKEEAEW